MAEPYNSCYLNITPARKRKRQCDNFENQQGSATDATAALTSCFTNAAFCSTPKKIVAKRRFHSNESKENVKVLPSQEYPRRSKSRNILKHGEGDEINKVPQNPFEVQRKPPKKKKRHITEELSCFENPALNLDLPEKLFNPYEVVRAITDNNNSNCFSNPALNLKVQDASILCNPFEVQRQLPNHESEKLSGNAEEKTLSMNPFKVSNEVKKEEKELTSKPCEFKLGLPFAPKLGCRVDFRDVSISQLSPSKLLAEKLVFSPVQNAKVSLGSTGEDSSMDIGKELDRYQLELENSINEAKLRKTGATIDMPLSILDNSQINFQPEQKTKFNQKLSDIAEDSEIEHIIEQTSIKTDHIFEFNIKREQIHHNFDRNVLETNNFRCVLDNQYQKTETAEVLEIENLDELYGCCANDKEDSLDFITPAPFVRAYTKQETTKLTVSKNSLDSLITDKSGKKEDDIKKSLTVKNMIRKSFRKLVHANQHGYQDKNKETSIDSSEDEKQKGFMKVIRHSFRRKPVKNPDEESTTKNEISIIDSTERTTKLKSDNLSTEYMKIEYLTNEKNTDLRKSLRKTTREMRNRLLKGVFHQKHEEYDLRK